MHRSIHLYVYPSIHLHITLPFAVAPVFFVMAPFLPGAPFPPFKSIYPSIHLSIHLSSISIDPSICLSIYPSTYHLALCGRARVLCDGSCPARCALPFCFRRDVGSFLGAAALARLALALACNKILRYRFDTHFSVGLFSSIAV